MRAGRASRLRRVLVMVIASTCRRPEQQAGAPLSLPDPAVLLAGLPAGATLPARLHTEAGIIRCVLEPGRAPAAVALFVGLATGRAAWRDPGTGAVTTRPLYRDRRFFRAIPGVLIQTGDPRDDGTGHPGYRLPVEARPDDGG